MLSASSPVGSTVLRTSPLYIELGRLLQILAHFVEFRLADHLLDAALEFARHGARLADPDTGGAQRFRQLFRPDDDQRNSADHQHFRPTEIKEHGGPGCGIPGRQARRLGTEKWFVIGLVTRADDRRKPADRQSPAKIADAVHGRPALAAGPEQASSRYRQPVAVGRRVHLERVHDAAQHRVVVRDRGQLDKPFHAVPLL